MVRKALILFVFCLHIALAMQAETVYAYDVYEGNVSSTYTAIYEDIITKVVKPNDEYVFFRSGQYKYVMLVGNISLTDLTFTYSNCKEYVINTTSISGYQNYYTYSSSDIPDGVLYVGDKLVYSSLGDYPTLSGDFYIPLFFYVFVVFCLCCFIERLFEFTMRRQS